MKLKINLGQALTILGNLTVVAGIAVLVVQIRQDRTYARLRLANSRVPGLAQKF